MKIFLTAMFLMLCTQGWADCQVTCTKLVIGPTAEDVDFFWYDANPGQCPPQQACVPNCEGGCTPFCLEEETGQSKAGMCIALPGPPA